MPSDLGLTPNFILKVVQMLLEVKVTVNLSELAVPPKETARSHPPWASLEPQAFPVTLITTSTFGLNFMDASSLVPHRIQPAGPFPIVIFNVFFGGGWIIFNQETESLHINLPKQTRVKY